MIVKGALRMKALTDRRQQKQILDGLFAEVFYRHESITAFRLHPHLVAFMGEAGEAFGQTIHLDTPFRVRAEVPGGHKQCSKCGVVLPKEQFRKAISRCEQCFKAGEKLRQNRYWIKKKQRLTGNKSDADP